MLDQLKSHPTLDVCKRSRLFIEEGGKSVPRTEANTLLYMAGSWLGGKIALKAKISDEKQQQQVGRPEKSLLQLKLMDRDGIQSARCRRKGVVGDATSQGFTVSKGSRVRAVGLPPVQMFK